VARLKNRFQKYPKYILGTPSNMLLFKAQSSYNNKNQINEL